MKLKGKVAVVTGSTRGIGQAIAELFSREGASVVVVGRDAVRGKKVVEKINNEKGKAVFIRTDVSNWNEVNKLMQTTYDSFGRIDLLVNNAGIGISKNFMDLTVEEWDQIMNVNLRGQFICCKAAAHYLVKQGGGNIINFSSVLAYMTLPGNTAYTASKAGIIGFTRALALDLAPHNIRVNVIVPGSIDTDMLWEDLEGEELEKARKEVASAQPLGYIGKPEEIARAALFLASEDSSFATGAPFILDGGLMTKIATTR